MSAGKEIRSKIGSIKNTQKITRAMEMISAAKMGKAQKRMLVLKPYAERIEATVKHVAHSHSEYHHPYFEQRPVRRIGMIVISTDRGLCGGFNANLFRLILKELQQWQSQNIEIDLCLIGSKAESFFRRISKNIIASINHLGDKPGADSLESVTKIMLDRYYEHQIDSVYIAGNQFVNSVTQKPYVKQLVPLVASGDDKLKHHWDYIYEPDAKQLLDDLLHRYTKSLVYQALVENIACEQAARRLAMKNASDNAGDIINELQLAYNKARQAAITKELSEIVAGAAAV